MVRFQNPLSQSIISGKHCDDNYAKKKHWCGLRQENKTLKYKHLGSL